jgi:ubiquinone/menaquinone biosynthesis C-methylase UbiE
MSDVKNIIQDHFGKQAAEYASSVIHAQGKDLEWMIEACDLKGQERVLDVGTGAGHTAFAFAPHVAKVEGLDITPAMLEQAELGAEQRGLENVRFSRGDVESIPRDDATYDIVTSRWCAHHYSHIRRAVSEIARVLKPGGTFLLVDSIAPGWARLDTLVNTLETLRDTGHVRNYSIQEWLAMLEAAGLHGEVIREWNLRLDGDNWVQRIQTPPAYVQAIKALLQEADDEIRSKLQITLDGDPAGWGFNLPTVLIRATRLESF